VRRERDTTHRRRTRSITTWYSGFSIQHSVLVYNHTPPLISRDGYQWNMLSAEALRMCAYVCCAVVYVCVCVRVCVCVCVCAPVLLVTIIDLNATARDTAAEWVESGRCRLKRGCCSAGSKNKTVPHLYCEFAQCKEYTQLVFAKNILNYLLLPMYHIIVILYHIVCAYYNSQ